MRAEFETQPSLQLHCGVEKNVNIIENFFLFGFTNPYAIHQYQSLCVRGTMYKA